MRGNGRAKGAGGRKGREGERGGWTKGARGRKGWEGERGGRNSAGPERPTRGEDSSDDVFAVERKNERQKKKKRSGGFRTRARGADGARRWRRMYLRSLNTLRAFIISFFFFFKRYLQKKISPGVSVTSTAACPAVLCVPFTAIVYGNPLVPSSRVHRRFGSPVRDFQVFSSGMYHANNSIRFRK